MLSQRQLAKLTTDLVKACGGTAEVLDARIISVGRTCLTDAMNPNGAASLKIADVLALEAYCGHAVLTGHAARIHKVDAAACLLKAISEADFSVSDLQHAYIRATSPDSDSGEALSANEKALLFEKVQTGLNAILAAAASLSERDTERG